MKLIPTIKNGLFGSRPWTINGTDVELQGIYGIFTCIYQPKWLINGVILSTYKSIKLMAFAWN